MHAAMEDGVDGVGKGFFKVLDEKFDGLGEKEGLHSAHGVSRQHFLPITSRMMLSLCVACICDTLYVRAVLLCHNGGPF